MSSAEEVIEPHNLPYWLVNVPRAQWPQECPKYLLNLPAKSIKQLSTPDDKYIPQNWEVVKRIVASNQIDDFQRVPSHLRKYLEYQTMIKARYGSIANFIVRERLRWEDDLVPKGLKPFGHPEDYKILFNDWPYGVEDGIIHLVVWTKFAFENDPILDDLTSQSRKEIDDFVGKVFRSKIPAERVIWFRNWSSLKSVQAVEHFHVMLYQPDLEFVRDITNGDVPLIDKETVDGGLSSD